MALLLIVILALGVGPVQIHCQKAVHHSVRITSDRGGEMSVELEGQAVVANVVGAVAGLGH